MKLKKTYNIFIAGIVQIMFAMYLITITLLQIKFKSTKLIVIIALLLYSVHLFISAISLLKRNYASQILSIANFLGLGIISIGGMLWVSTRRLVVFSFWMTFFCLCFYFVYFLSRPSTKYFFQQENRKKGNNDFGDVSQRDSFQK